MKKIIIIFATIFNYTTVHTSENTLSKAQVDIHSKLSVYMGGFEQEFLKTITITSRYDLKIVLRHHNLYGGSTLLHDFVHCGLRSEAIIRGISSITDHSLFIRETCYGETPLYVGCGSGVTPSSVIIALLQRMRETAEGREAITRKIFTDNGLEARYTSALTGACSHRKSQDVIKELVETHVEADENDPHLVETLVRYQDRYSGLLGIFKEVIGAEKLNTLIASSRLPERNKTLLQEKIKQSGHELALEEVTIHTTKKCQQLSLE